MSKHYRKSNEKSTEQAEEHHEERGVQQEDDSLREEERRIRAWERQRELVQYQHYMAAQQREAATMAMSIVMSIDFSRSTEDERRDEKAPPPFFHVVSPQMRAAAAEHVMKAPDTCRCWHCMDAKPPTISAAVKAAQESERKRIALCCGAAARMRQVCAN